MSIQLITNQQKKKLAETVVDKLHKSDRLKPEQKARIEACLTHEGSLVWVHGTQTKPTAVVAVTAVPNEAGLLIINHLSPLLIADAETEVSQILGVVKKYASENNFTHILVFAHSSNVGARMREKPYHPWTKLGYRLVPWLMQEMPKSHRNSANDTHHLIAPMILNVRREKVHTETTNKQTNRQRSNRNTANRQRPPSSTQRTKNKKPKHNDFNSTDGSSEMNSTEYSEVVSGSSSSSNMSSCDGDEFLSATSSSYASSSEGDESQTESD